MFKEWKEFIHNIINSRLLVLLVVLVALPLILVHRLFDLQIVNGQNYLDSFELKIQKEKTLSSTRGNIRDRDGELLAYNELAYAVTIEDNYDSGDTKNAELNDTIMRLIDIVEGNGDEIINDFNIVLDSGQFKFAVEDKALLRFLADIYGHTTTDQLSFKEKNSTPEQVIEYLCGKKKFGIGGYEDQKEKNFKVGLGYTDEELLKVLTIRYAMSLNGYQKYIPTMVASSVSDRTVAVVMENKDSLQGVDIAEDTLRRYVDSVYFSHLLGYTGKISQEEFSSLSLERDDYVLNDMVGKAGIEQVMETELQGKKGHETIFVDNMGRTIEVSDRVEPVAGNDLYLTIDKDLQKAVYKILEQKIAGILVKYIKDIKEFTLPENASASNIRIPIDDVYFALLNNNVVDINHFNAQDAKPNERQIYQKFLTKQEQVLKRLENELLNARTPYNQLDAEMQVYESFIVSMLSSAQTGVIVGSEVNTADETYQAWTTEETISIREYLEYAIAMNWIDITKFDLENKYADSEEIYGELVQYILKNLRSNSAFSKKLYKYMIRDNELTGREVCLLLFEQSIIPNDSKAKSDLESGAVSAFTFMVDKIRSMKITPAQLALDPCSGSAVVTDVNTGEILACVTYPSYDNNRLANSIDSDYYNRLSNDLSKPLWDYATQQKTAPGSTYKMVSSVAALEEGVVNLGEIITCKGSFDKIDLEPKCWIYPRSHGALDIVGGIKNSCNYFFYEVGYRLSTDVTGKYDSALGLGKLSQYAELFGLTEPSGIEITESEPQVSTEDSVRSAIGQGTNNYTTVGLSRYVTTVANSGTCYNISLLGKLTDSAGNLLKDYKPQVRNTIDIASSTWDAVHAGMRGVVENAQSFKTLKTAVAGKTGTAQESKIRPNHALFVGYGPYENPRISIAVRIANGYTSANSAEVGRDIFKYYFKEVSEDELITGTAAVPDSTIAGD